MAYHSNRNIKKNIHYCGYCRSKMVMPYELFKEHLDYCEVELVERYNRKIKKEKRKIDPDETGWIG